MVSLSLLFHLHFLSFCLSPANPHNTIHQNSTTLFCHHQNYPKKKPTSQSRRHPALNNPPQTHRKNNHIPIPETITYPYRKTINIPTPAQPIQLHHRRPTQHPPNQPNAPNPKPQTHGQTNFSNLRPTPPQSYPLLKSQTKSQNHGKKIEGSLSRKIKGNKLGFGEEMRF